ncbi:MAG: hypothetical protein PWQ88_933 [Candidatus Methanomethylophilaceae archaeon]|nr:MAG: Molecular chaperone (Small heat shock protein) [Thermoplasmatales archaeon 49_6]MDI3483062.1 hypothetical protein [Candidatus Methanomethylophilaceae archaeon]MDI3542151.1 hypothetical protein [Candidatus Methanomethylophilaceae archaeon]HIJ00921.1 Hsp20/alpha crystallin family protein [Candidatus Methanomethylophilaceae archaeon]
MSGWDDLFREFEEMEERLERMFREFISTEGGTPGGRLWGYTMYRGPDGVPHVREFGTEIGSSAELPLGKTKEGVREPFTDVTHEGNEIRIVVELPGVSKEDIDLQTTPTSMTVSVDSENRKYHKTLKLPTEVDPNSAKAEYNNGILEVVLKTAHIEPAPRKVNIQ